MVQIKENKFKDYFNAAVRAIIEYPQRHIIIHRLLMLFNSEINVFKTIIASICWQKNEEHSTEEAQSILRDLKDLAISEGGMDELEMKQLLTDVRKSLESEYQIDLSYFDNL